MTVTQLPVTRCQICDRTVAYPLWPGTLTEVLTEHYRRAHPEALEWPERMITMSSSYEPTSATAGHAATTAPDGP